MAIMYVGCTGRQRVVDARGNYGVVDRIRDRFDDQYSIVGTERIDLDIKLEDFRDWVEQQETKLYDHSSIFGLALKRIGLVATNPFGKNWKKMTCNEMPLSIIKRFIGKEIGDSDNYDLLMTYQVVRDVASGQRVNP